MLGQVWEVFLICTIKDFWLFKFNCLLFRWLNIGGAGFFLNIVYFSAGGKYMNIWACDVPSAGESNLNWLVVWNVAFILHNIWVVILPIDELHHFSRWWNCTTNQKNNEAVDGRFWNGDGRPCHGHHGPFSAREHDENPLELVIFHPFSDEVLALTLW